MLKKFQNSYTKYTNPKTQITFKIGDEVLGAGNIRGKIVALSAGADFLLDTGDIIPYGRKIVHAPKPVVEPEKLFESPQKTAKKSSTPRASSKENCETENKRLRRELEECTSRTLPKVVENAPAEVQPKLPEVRQESIVQDMRVSANNIIMAAQSGDKATIRTEEKKITEAVKELKEVAPLQTVSASEDCRVIRSDMAGKPTIRIYFAHKVSDETKTVLLRNNFSLRWDLVNKKKEWYWGAWFSEERLTFATSFCKESKAKATESIQTTSNKSKIKVFLTDDEMGALMGAERVKAIRHELNIVYPEIKFSIIKTSYNACSIYIISAPYDFKRISRDNTGEAKKVFDGITEIANRGITTTPDSDYGNVPDFYVSIVLGQNGVPFNYSGEGSASHELNKRIKAEDSTKKKFEIARTVYDEYPKTTSRDNDTHPNYLSSKVRLSPLLAKLMPIVQQKYLRELNAEGVREMQSVIAQVEKQVADIRKSQQTGKQAIVKAHYFYGGSDWYVTEMTSDARLYGYAILNNDYEYSEFGYMSIDEFNATGKVEMDFHWTPRPLDEVLYKKSPQDYPKPKSMMEKEKPTSPQAVRTIPAKSHDPLPTPDEPDNDGDNELKELMAMMKAALAGKDEKKNLM